MAAPVRTAYVLSSQVAFVPHPREPGRWLRLHPSVLFVKCPGCGQRPGKPCVNREGEVVATFAHYQRRSAGRYRLPAGVPGMTVVIAPRKR